MDTRTLKDRVTRRLAELQLNPFEAARRGGLGREFVNDIVTGRKKTIRGDNIAKLAVALDWSADELLGRRPLKDWSLDDFHRAAMGNKRVPIVGLIARDRLWHDNVMEDMCSWYSTLPTLPADFRFLKESQVDYVVLDNSAPSLAPAGHLVRCINHPAWLTPEGGAKVFVVERVKDGLRELTIRYSRRSGPGGNERLWLKIEAQPDAREDDLADDHRYAFCEPLEIGEGPGCGKKVAAVLFSYRALSIDW